MQTLYSNYDWDETTNQWIGGYKYIYGYNENGNDSIDIGYAWDETNLQWGDINYEGIYYYSEQNITALYDIETEIFKLYPNPASEYLSFNISPTYNQIIFELYNMSGHKILIKEIDNSYTINIEGLKTGIYSYRLFLDKKIKTGKLIK
jgi:hypothetical protein